jgi:hypothetical protein
MAALPPVIMSAPAPVEIGHYSSLYKYCRSEPSIKNNIDFEGNSIPLSHNSLCGKTKSFSVTDDRLDRFYEQAAKAWNEPTFLSENAGGSEYPLFFDLDIYISGDSAWTHDDSVKTVKFLVDEMIKVIVDRDDECRVVITASEPVSISTDDSDKIKVGIHFFIPSISVDSDTHIQLRAIILVLAMQVNKDRIGFDRDDEGNFVPLSGKVLLNSWSDVIDKSICLRPKLRMISARKAGPCKHTKQEKADKVCPRPNRHIMDYGRKYDVIEILEFDGQEFIREDTLYNRFTGLGISVFSDDAHKQQIIADRKALLLLISLRNSDVTSGMEFPDNIDDYLTQAAEYDGAEAEMGIPKKLKDVELPGDIVKVVSQFIIVLGLVNHVDDIDKVKAAGTGKYPSIYTVNLKSRWCFNKGSDHTSNNVYVQVSLSFLRFSFNCFFLFFLWCGFLAFNCFLSNCFPSSACSCHTCRSSSRY